MANHLTWKETEARVGDLISVYQKIEEEGKTRTQVFEGILIAVRGRGENKSFRVRKISADGVGVERIWPLISPWITKIVVKKKGGKVRRAKLFYLRQSVNPRR